MFSSLYLFWLEYKNKKIKEWMKKQGQKGNKPIFIRLWGIQKFYVYLQLLYKTTKILKLVKNDKKVSFVTRLLLVAGKNLVLY
jgi:uncharacterized Fe-S cluster-containing radical SAM superfamily enzyme